LSPILWNSIPAWPLFFSFAWVLSYFYFKLLLKVTHQYQWIPKLYAFYLGLYVFGWLGSRIWADLLEYDDPHGFGGPLSFYGGVVSGIIYIMIFTLKTKPHHVPFPSYFLKLSDYVIPSTLVGLGIGRMGCWLNGDDFGLPLKEDVWWASYQWIGGHAVPCYPVQWIEIFSCLILGSLAFYLHKKSLKSLTLRLGFIGSVCGVVSQMVRFLIEFIRGDERVYIIFHLTLPQLCSLILSVYFVLVMFLGKRTKVNLI